MTAVDKTIEDDWDDFIVKSHPGKTVDHWVRHTIFFNLQKVIDDFTRMPKWKHSVEDESIGTENF